MPRQRFPMSNPCASSWFHAVRHAPVPTVAGESSLKSLGHKRRFCGIPRTLAIGRDICWLSFCRYDRPSMAPRDQLRRCRQPKKRAKPKARRSPSGCIPKPRRQRIPPIYSNRRIRIMLWRKMRAARCFSPLCFIRCHFFGHALDQIFS
jgi:hypothetical protein